MRILGISGSLRSGSFNSSALRTCAELLPDDVEFRSFGRPAQIPLFNEDVRQHDFPESVEELRGEIAEADAVIIATPVQLFGSGRAEERHRLGVMPPSPTLQRKAGRDDRTSRGIFGTARAQYHLRQSFVYLNATVLNRRKSSS